MDEDSLWKEVLDRYLDDFLFFFFPSVHRDIDWSAGVEFRDKELQAILRGTRRGRRVVDKLVRVRLGSGAEAWILLHIEIEGRARKSFPERMYTYNHRIFERYRQEVISLAVLPHAGRRFRAEPFRRKRWGFELLFSFPCVKFSDYGGREKELARSSNPFALLVLAHLRRGRSRRDPRGLFAAKRDAVELLYRKRYTRDNIVQLFRFLDWLLELPPELEEEFRSWLEEYEGARSMPYITSVERIGHRRGLEEGRQEGLRDAIEAHVTRRFGRKGSQLLAAVQLPGEIAALRRLLGRIIDAASLEEVSAALERASRAPKKGSRGRDPDR